MSPPQLMAMAITAVAIVIVLVVFGRQPVGDWLRTRRMVDPVEGTLLVTASSTPSGRSVYTNYRLLPPARRGEWTRAASLPGGAHGSRPPHHVALPGHDPAGAGRPPGPDPVADLVEPVADHPAGALFTTIERRQRFCVVGTRLPVRPHPAGPSRVVIDAAALGLG
jgi:hypothetical protein